MRKRALTILLVGGVFMVVAGLALPAERIVHALIPARGAAYAEKLIAGMKCLKFALIVNGLIAICFQPLKRWLWDAETTPSAAPRQFFRHADPGKLRGGELFIFLGIVALALILRLWGARQSLFGDEIAVQQMFISRGLPVILTYFPYTPHHVMYSVLAWFFEKLPLSIELSYRLPAILFGVGAVALTYGLARRIFDRPTAVVTGVLSAVAVYGIAYSQTAKGYSATHCLTLVAFWALTKLATDWRAPAGWGWFAVAMGALGYVHLYNAYLCVGLTTCCAGILWWTGAGWGGMKRLVYVLTILAGILFLLYALQLPQIREQVARASSQPEEHLSLNFLRGWLAQLTFWGAAWPVALACVVLAVIGAGALAKREPWFAFVVLGTPAVLILLVALKDSWILPRYLVFTLPVFLILCVEGARLIGKTAGVVVFAWLFLWPTTLVLAHYYRVGHQNIRAAARLVEGQTAVAYGLARDLFPFYNARIKPIATFAEVQSLTGEVYLVYGWRKAWRGRENEFRYLDQHFTVVQRFDGFAMDLFERDGEVVVLRSPP